MRITFLNHSCIRIEFKSGLDIICDPWFKSKVFNNSWRLLSESQPIIHGLNGNTLIYISHEHPDHLNFPTLKTFFGGQYVISRRDVRHEVRRALIQCGLGFCGIQTNIMHVLPSGDQIGIFTYYGDSCLFALDGITGKSIFNFNDCEFDENYFAQLRTFLPSNISLVAGQFGLAGYYGNHDQAQMFKAAKLAKLTRLASVTDQLNASLVLPFASYAAFCKKHNTHINHYQVKMAEVKSSLSTLKAKIWIPLPNSHIDLSQPYSQDDLDSNSGLGYWSKLQELSRFSSDTDDKTTFIDIQKSMLRLQNRCRSKKICELPKMPKYKIGIIINENIVPALIDLTVLQIAEHNSQDDISFHIPSDELNYAFNYRWGADTLNITGSAYVKLIEVYRAFCCNLDYILKLAY